MYNGGNDNDWRDSNYQLQMDKDHEHRKMAGVGTFLSESSQSVQVQNYEKAISTKDYSRPYYCKVCHIDCSSDCSLQSHLEGKSHAKKLRLLGLEKVVDSKIAVKPTTRMPKFVFLSHKIQANPNEPVIGLHYIEEFLTETNTNANEPRYTCNLCVVTGEVEPTWSHLIGSKHRQNYMEMTLSMKVDKSTIRQAAFEVEMREGRDVKKITRTISDAKYPMPQNLKPKKVKKDPPPPPKLSPPPPPSPKSPIPPVMSITDPSSSVKHLLSALVKGAVKSEHDAELAFNVCQCLIAKLGEYRAKNSSTSSQTMKEWDAVFDSLTRVNNASKAVEKKSGSPSTSQVPRNETQTVPSKERQHCEHNQQRVHPQQQQKNHQQFDEHDNGPHQRKRPRNNHHQNWQEEQNYQNYGHQQSRQSAPPRINHQGAELHPNLCHQKPKGPPKSLLSLNLTKPQ